MEELTRSRLLSSVLPASVQLHVTVPTTAQLMPVKWNKIRRIHWKTVVRYNSLSFLEKPSDFRQFSSFPVSWEFHKNYQAEHENFRGSPSLSLGSWAAGQLDLSPPRLHHYL